MNTPVKFELAQLLKDKEFSELVNNYFSNNGNEECFRPYKANYNSSLNVGLTCSRPIISDVVMWLYEKHGIWIIAIPEGISTTWCFSMFNVDPEKGRIIFESPSFNSPTGAYEAAIEYTLNNLI